MEVNILSVILHSPLFFVIAIIVASGVALKAGLAGSGDVPTQDVFIWALWTVLCIKLFFGTLLLVLVQTRAIT